MKLPKFSLNKWNFTEPFEMFGETPEGDWKIIFVSTMIISLATMVVSAVVFLTLDKRSVFEIETVDATQETLNVRVLKDTVSYYQGKSAEFERVKREGVSIVDPSL